MNAHLKTIELGGTILTALAPAVVWHWVTGRGQSRWGTFFGARTEPGFAESSSGEAILRQFRRRLWGWSLAGMAMCVLAIAWASVSSPPNFGDGAFGLSHGIFMVASLIGSSAGVLAFAMAHRRTRCEAAAPAESTIRTASLAAQEEPEGVWLRVLDWLAMAAPPSVPVATLIVLALCWHRFPSGSDEARLSLETAYAALGFGLFCTANSWALIYRTRSSDWALTASASHRYRTYLGLPMTCVMTLIIAELCAMSLTPLKDTVAWLHHWNVLAVNATFLPCMAAVGIFGWSMRVWLSKRRDRGSGDPMADKYWKWGQFYCNPGDPALMVPTRTGDMYSPNYSRPSIWVVCGALAIVLAGFWVRLNSAMRAEARESQRIEHGLQQEMGCDGCGGSEH